ncbi:serine-rich adhesin for platelets [Musca domestica]|uniref:Uncharacterized protein LOC101891864 n=1 Tax=Musca domestica TaxID=7370 RepID=A0A1I8MF14_MUSDO|nr:serine-rich adhesin for platelets [Musca domestica]
MTAENYHLKWDSHHSYLNSSVATLYKNEKYADVVLYSSNSTISTNNSMPIVGISAHKFILSSCSQFFSSIFETSPISSNGSNFHIVLPPDLSHRAIQILVQYMYMGEATVSNDILSEVLKGGEILKIRGLCRTSNPVTNVQTNRSSETIQTSPANGATYNLIRMPLTNGPTSVRYLVEQQASTVSRSLNVSTLPKTSPVIVKSTKPLNTITVPSAVNIGKLAGQHPISVNKHVAIDPGEKCCYTAETTTTSSSSSSSSTTLRDESSSSICNEIGCNDCTRMTTENHATQQILVARDGHAQMENNGNICHTHCPEYLQQTAGNECVEDSQYDQEMHLSSEHAADYNVSSARNENYKYSQHLISTTASSSIAVTVPAQSLPPTTSTQVVVHQDVVTIPTYVAIKEEPSEWMAASSSSASAIHHGNGLHPTSAASSLPSSSSSLNKKTAAQNHEYKMQKIKTETPPQPQATPTSTTSLKMGDGDNCKLISNVANDFETYFSCDICKKVCEDKTSLVRHLETHAAPTPGTSSSFTVPPPPVACETTTVATAAAAAPSKSSYVPKKRRRISQQENTSEHVCLQCDICNTRFETPQEWVRHMSTQHTEVELAIYNNKKDAEKNNQPSTSNHNKKQASNVQQQQQRVQTLISGSTNSNITNSTSVVCTSPPTAASGSSGGAGNGGTGSGISDPNATGYLRSTLSPA